MPLYFDATFSWSGYSYQGKVGLYVLLKKINAYNGNNIQDEFQNWELEFEWLEDFSIKQNGVYLSLHQVKTLKSRRISDYNTAIEQTIYNANNALDYPITPYFHVSSNVNNPNNIFYTYIINNIPQRYCPLNQIDNLLKEQIKIFLQTHNQRDNNEEAKTTHFNKLLAIVDNHVKQRHMNIQTQPANIRQVECINFSEIINSLIIDSHQLSQERIIYEKKAYFVSIIDEYCQNKNDDIKTKVNKVCRDLLDLDDNDFTCFIKSISPHIQSPYDNSLYLSDFQGLLQPDATKGCFLRSISQINGFDVFIEKKYLEKSTKKYLPTTINREEDAVDEICQDVLDNPFAIENLFEMDCFITERIKCDSIEKNAYNTTEIREEDMPDIDNLEYKINELKKVEMITIEDAKGILND